MSKFVKYSHHGKNVWTAKKTKGKHQKYCLCHSCKRFFPNSNLRNNCKTADHIFTLNRVFGLVTPVFECPDFVEE